MKEFLNRFNLTLIIVCYSAIVLALYEQLHIYVVLFGVLCACWRGAHFFGWIALMPRFLLSAVAIATSALTVGLLYQQGVFNIMLHLIFLGFSLKFLELRSTRDVYFFVNTGFILIALFFIFNTSIVATLVASFLLLLLFAILLSLHAQRLVKNAYLTLLFKSCLLSLPLAIVLFVVMPRLPSLWKMPIQKQATTGLSDTVSPGEIAKLSRSSALAFRATFSDVIAPESERYWRAMTLDNFDGRTWSQSTSLKQEESMAKRGGGRQFYQTKNAEQPKSEYELIIEPHYNYWLPVLDYALTPTGLVSLSDYSLRSDKPVIARQAITVAQTSAVKTQPLTANQIRQFTQLPERKSALGNDRTDAWIAENLSNGLSKESILAQLLNGFSESFRYTLEPPRLGEKQIDDFLFNSQAGFCVHFASSYLYVARRLGFPARMVTGYLGGEWQASEGFFTIRQYDAHAWVEIWRENRWQRVDPTAYVAPERVESGLQAALTDGNEFLADEYFSLQKWQSVELINLLRGRLAQMDYLWARYVVNFDNQSQVKLMQRWLSKIPWLKLAYAVMLVMAIIFAALLLIIFKPWQVNKITIEDKIYLQLQGHFNKQGMKREAGQSVSEYCLLLSKTFLLSDSLCQSFALKYNAIKYQTRQTKGQRKKQIKQLIFISKQLTKR
ncbi:transglutaminase family protein [Psychromonas sp. Urea-02u-13]|uniref:transglutaminase family protein n=1 Tax=Psychromonas sp. Urea-02u-13 TaxID=2058326 RepID=UPI000C32AF24|nr:DUF3488 and transglutaminase-like domain-containing protein [Psychromonas sp. Urea-02u-13]PKG41001.1 DUF3488 domain-containing protein [Psychromonas sp. Urea-02u-13]